MEESEGLKMKKEININTEKKILDVATKLFAQKGFDGTSTRDICNEAGVNISLISYYFGGKQELYAKVVSTIVENIIAHMMSKVGIKGLPQNFDFLNQQQKIDLLFKLLGMIIDYFYSEVSDSQIMILLREQMTSGIPINPEGYKVFKRLLASILGKSENDKEIIFRTITIVGQIQSARIIKQFSLKIMNQSGYSKDDIQMLKQIITEQTRFILQGMGVKWG